MARSDDDPDLPICWLCERPLGEPVERHHPVPKSRKGRLVVDVHPICHRTLHARYTNSEMARLGEDLEAIRSDDEIAAFLRWIANKPADFHAPTRKRR